MQTLKPFSLRVDAGTISQYAQITQDWNPLHVDEEFASRSAMQGVIAHGTLSLNLLWQSLQASLPESELHRITLDVRFLRPVRPGDTVRSEGELSVAGRWSVRVITHEGDVVISGFACMDADGAGDLSHHQTLSAPARIGHGKHGEGVETDIQPG